MPDIALNEVALTEAAQAAYQLTEWDHGFGHVPSMDVARAAVTAYLNALQLPDPYGWWPMDSAPKDGTFIAIDLGINRGIPKVRWAAERPYPGWETEDEEPFREDEPSMWRRLREGE